MLFTKAELEANSNNHEEDAAGLHGSASASRFLNVEAHRVDNAKDIIRLPCGGEILFLQTMGSFNAFTIVQFLSKLQHIEELWATTYSVSISVLEAMQEMQKRGKIGAIRLLISDSMRSRNPRVCDALNAWAQSNNQVTIIYAWNHSKITLCKTPHGYYCIEGSGNWSKNAAYEQYVFCNDQEVFNLRKNLFRDCKVVHRIN